MRLRFRINLFNSMKTIVYFESCWSVELDWKDVDCVHQHKICRPVGIGVVKHNTLDIECILLMYPERAVIGRNSAFSMADKLWSCQVPISHSKKSCRASISQTSGRYRVAFLTQTWSTSFHSRVAEIWRKFRSRCNSVMLMWSQISHLHFTISPKTTQTKT